MKAGGKRRRHAGAGERINIGRICAACGNSGVPATMAPSGPWMTGMRRLTSFDFVRYFAKHSDAAVEKPIAINRYGRDRLVMMNVDLYRELLDSALARKDRRAEPLQARLRKE